MVNFMLCDLYYVKKHSTQSCRVSSSCWHLNFASKRPFHHSSRPTVASGDASHDRVYYDRVPIVVHPVPVSGALDVRQRMWDLKKIGQTLCKFSDGGAGGGTVGRKGNTKQMLAAGRWAWIQWPVKAWWIKAEKPTVHLSKEEFNTTKIVLTEMS